MTLCLTQIELIELTDYKRKREQARALDQMGIRYMVSPAGRVKVLRSSLKGETERAREEPIL